MPPNSGLPPIDGQSGVIATVHRAVKNGPSAVAARQQSSCALYPESPTGSSWLETSRAISACSMGIPTCRFARIHLVHSRAEGLSLLGPLLLLQVFFVWKRESKSESESEKKCESER